MFTEILKLIQPYLGIVAVLYPAIQIYAKTQGVNLPDLGDLGNVLSTTGGAALVAKSEKI